ncbi:MAG: Aspartyl/glutamyl-tRNA(Asn/Gln) amidotransferase subunit B [candidate division TM6 bacterium GW2011_GWF2_32_72]|nr:MAG: Aspartyl/glutamyl-tRNA(Asn/Gln) amidotransferase subunit B [candidate division TM6 bacterium GW2011_GWF2_32_72]
MSSNSILEKYPNYKTDIGIEIHVQLTTKSKIFCSCPNTINPQPNSTICQVCAGYPGVLPVLNKEVVNMAIMAGLATNCTINKISEFDRKHYFYPDLPKGYQITQGKKPICNNGYIEITKEDGTTKKVRINRIHIEEDAGKNTHSDASLESFVDLNRAGTPLLEIVTEPDIESAHEAREYLKNLRLIVQHLGICTGNMEEGAFRGDTNISVRKKDSLKLGTKCELKNINSFKFISDAIEYEIERQIIAIESGEKILQETRLWDSKEKKTFVMRVKGEAADYRYLNDPDMPILEIQETWIKEIQKSMPELPQEKKEKLKKDFGLSDYEANILLNEREISTFFETCFKINPSKQLINWILRDLIGFLKEEKILLAESKITPELMANFTKLLDDGKINSRVAKEVFDEFIKTGEVPSDIVKNKGLESITSVNEIEKIIKQIIASNPKQLEEYKSGKTKLFGFFVGKTMEATAGKCDPKILQELLHKYLN